MPVQAMTHPSILFAEGLTTGSHNSLEIGRFCYQSYYVLSYANHCHTPARSCTAILLVLNDIQLTLQQAFLLNHYDYANR